MAHHDQVEQTEEAQRQRRGRQRQAAPGGFHDRLIKILAIALPMATGAIVAFLVIAPFSPRSEVSFTSEAFSPKIARSSFSSGVS